MKDLLKLTLFFLLSLSLAACQEQKETDGSIIEENQESTFTLNGAAE